MAQELEQLVQSAEYGPPSPGAGAGRVPSAASSLLGSPAHSTRSRKSAVLKQSPARSTRSKSSQHVVIEDVSDHEDEGVANPLAQFMSSSSSRRPPSPDVTQFDLDHPPQELVEQQAAIRQEIPRTRPNTCARRRQQEAAAAAATRSRSLSPVQTPAAKPARVPSPDGGPTTRT